MLLLSDCFLFPDYLMISPSFSILTLPFHAPEIAFRSCVTCYASAWMAVHKFRQIIDLEHRLKNQPFPIASPRLKNRITNVKMRYIFLNDRKWENPALSRIYVTKWILMREEVVLKAEDQEQYQKKMALKSWWSPALPFKATQQSSGMQCRLTYSRSWIVTTQHY